MVKKSLKHDNAGFLIGNPVTDGSVLKLLENIADTSEKTYKAIVAGTKNRFTANSKRPSTLVTKTTTPKTEKINAVVSPTVIAGKKQSTAKNTNKAQEPALEMPKTTAPKPVNPKTEKVNPKVTESTRTLRENQKKNSEVKASNGLAKKIIGLTNSLEAIDLKDNLKQFSGGATDLIEKSDANAEALKEIAVVAKPFGGAVKFIASRGFGKLFKFKKDKEKTVKPLTTNATSMGGMGGMLSSITSFLPTMTSLLPMAGTALLGAGSGLLKKIPFISSAMAVFDGVSDYQKAENNQEKASAIGGAGGAIAGSIAGAAVGTAILPVVGTAIGGALGAFLGSKLGKAVASSVYESFEDISSSMVDVWDTAVNKFSSIWDSVKSAALNLFGEKPIEAVKNVWQGVKDTGSGVVDFVSNGVKRLTGNDTDTVIQRVGKDEGLGSLSARYEGKVGSANKDNKGHAYGKYQFNSETGGLNTFMNDNPLYAQQFKGIEKDSPAFYKKWREIASLDPKGFETAQDKTAKKMYYEPAAITAKKYGFDITNRGVQEAIFSGSINHGVGGVGSIIKNAAKTGNISNMTQEQQIQAFYSARKQFVAQSKLKEEDKVKLFKRYALEQPNAINFSKTKANAATQTTPFLAKPIAGIPVAKSNFLSNASLPSVEPPATSPLQTVSTQKIINTQKSTEKPFWVAQDIGNQRIAHIVSGGASGKN